METKTELERDVEQFYCWGMKVITAPQRNVDRVIAELSTEVRKCQRKLKEPITVPWHGMSKDLMTSSEMKSQFIVMAIFATIFGLIASLGALWTFNVFIWIGLILTGMVLLLLIVTTPSPWNHLRYEEFKRTRMHDEMILALLKFAGLKDNGWHLRGPYWSIAWPKSTRAFEVAFIEMEPFKGVERQPRYTMEDRLYHPWSMKYRIEGALNQVYSKIIDQKTGEYCYIDLDAMYNTRLQQQVDGVYETPDLELPQVLCW